MFIEFSSPKEAVESIEALNGAVLTCNLGVSIRASMARGAIQNDERCDAKYFEERFIPCHMELSRLHLEGKVACMADPESPRPDRWCVVKSRPETKTPPRTSAAHQVTPKTVSKPAVFATPKTQVIVGRATSAADRVEVTPKQVPAAKDSPSACLDTALAGSQRQLRNVKDSPGGGGYSERFETEFQVAIDASQVYVRTATLKDFNKAVNGAIDALPFAKSPLNRLRTLVLVVALYAHQGQTSDAVKYAFEAFDNPSELETVDDIQTCVNLLVLITLLIERFFPSMATEQYRTIKIILSKQEIHSAWFDRGAPVALLEHLVPCNLGKDLSTMVLCRLISIDVFA